MHYRFDHYKTMDQSTQWTLSHIALPWARGVLAWKNKMSWPIIYIYIFLYIIFLPLRFSTYRTSIVETIFTLLFLESGLPSSLSVLNSGVGCSLCAAQWAIDVPVWSTASGRNLYPIWRLKSVPRSNNCTFSTHGRSFTIPLTYENFRALPKCSKREEVIIFLEKKTMWEKVTLGLRAG